MLYLYGVVRAGHPAPDKAGLGAPPQPVGVIEAERVAALVSELPDGYQVHEEDARAHLQVLITALRGGPVVPLRMGTVAEDEAQARAVLDAQDTLLGTLESLDGLVELQVDADDDEAALVAEIARSAPVMDTAGADLASRIEVGQRVGQLLVEHRVQLAEQIVERLRRLAVDDVPRAQIAGPEDPVLRWAFLVKADDVGLFDEAIVALRAEFPSVSFRYVGPLPAAHFVDREPVSATDPVDNFHGNGSWGW